jgi:hypothetical protein
MMRWSLPVACLLTLAACASAPEATAPAPVAAPAPAAPAAAVRPSGIFLANIDRSVRPQDDLYRFVNGAWLAKTEIPSDKSNYGAFTILQDGAEKNLKAIAEEDAAAGAAAGTDRQLVGDFYSSSSPSSRASTRSRIASSCSTISRARRCSASTTSSTPTCSPMPGIPRSTRCG